MIENYHDICQKPAQSNYHPLAMDEYSFLIPRKRKKKKRQLGININFLGNDQYTKFGLLHAKLLEFCTREDAIGLMAHFIRLAFQAWAAPSPKKNIKMQRRQKHRAPMSYDVSLTWKSDYGPSSRTLTYRDGWLSESNKSFLKRISFFKKNFGKQTAIFWLAHIF